MKLAMISAMWKNILQQFEHVRICALKIFEVQKFYNYGIRKQRSIA